MEGRKEISRYTATIDIRQTHEKEVPQSSSQIKRIHGPYKTMKNNSMVVRCKHQRNIGSTCTTNPKESRLTIERLETLESAMRIVMERIG